MSDLVGFSEGQLGGDTLRLCGGGLSVENQLTARRVPASPRPGGDVTQAADGLLPGGRATWWERRCRNMLFQQLRSLSFGVVTVNDRDGSWTFGEEQDGGGGRTMGPAVTLTVSQPVAYRRMVASGDLGFAEALIAGELHCDSLVALLRILIVHAQGRAKGVGQQVTWRRWWANLRHWSRRNHRANSRRNIQAHYDLSNEFFSLWLDPTLSYSSGVFPQLQAVSGASGLEWQSSSTLETASVNKLERICQKLELTSEDHLLEIGCGWGGLALHAAERYGCRVTGVTLSPAQLAAARERIARAGLSDRVSLELVDYRDIAGRFDKLVSVEMVEAVGHQYLDEYFGTCCRLLKPDGRMVLQGITIGDQRYPQYLKQVDFIREYIFPGGCLISQSAVLRSVAQATDFRLTHLEDIGQHYAETLRRWRAAFHESWPQIEQMGFDMRFFRMWDYYLAYCEAGFAEGHVGAVQIVLDRQRRTAPVELPQYQQQNFVDRASGDDRLAAGGRSGGHDSYQKASR